MTGPASPDRSSERPPERYEVAVTPLGSGRGARRPRLLAALVGVGAFALLVAAGHLPEPETSPAPSGRPVAVVASGAPSDAPAVSPDLARCHSRLDEPHVYGVQPVGLSVDGGVPIPGSPNVAGADAPSASPAAAPPEWAWPAGPIVRIPAGAAVSVVAPEGACLGTISVTGPSGLVAQTWDETPGGRIDLVMTPPRHTATEPLVVRFGVGPTVAYAWTLVREPGATPTVRLTSAATGESLTASIGFCSLERTWRNGYTERRICAGAYDPRQVSAVLHTRVGDAIAVGPESPWTAISVGVACFAAPPGVTANGATVSLSTGPMITDACSTAARTLTALKKGTFLAYVTVNAVLDGNQVYGDWMVLIQVD